MPITWKLVLLAAMFGLACLGQAKKQSLFLILITSHLVINITNFGSWMMYYKAMESILNVQ